MVNGNLVAAGVTALISLVPMIIGLFKKNKEDTSIVGVHLGKELARTEVHLEKFPSLCAAYEKACSDLYDFLPFNEVRLNEEKLEKAMQLASEVSAQMAGIKEYVRTLAIFLNGCTRMNKLKIEDMVVNFAHVCDFADSKLQEIKVILKRGETPSEELVREFDTDYRSVAISHQEVIDAFGEVNTA